MIQPPHSRDAVVLWNLMLDLQVVKALPIQLEAIILLALHACTLLPLMAVSPYCNK